MKKKIIILLSSIITLLASSIAVSFAWYAEGSSLKISNITLSITGEKSIFISTSGEENSFKEKLNKEDLNEINNFIPVSSMYSDWINEKSSTPKFKQTFNSEDLGDKIPLDATKGYFSQKLYLYSEDDVLVTLDKETTNFLPAIDDNKEMVNFIKNEKTDKSDEEILSGLNSIVESTRISILNTDIENYSYYIIDTYKNGETYLGGILDNNADGYYDYYMENNNKYETLFGEVINRENVIYDDANSVDSDINGDYSCFNAKTKKDVKHLNIEKSKQNGVEIAKENSISLSEIENKVQIPLKAYTPKEIVLSIYIEGWDLDNTNVSQFGSFMANIQFKILREVF